MQKKYSIAKSKCAGIFLLALVLSGTLSGCTNMMKQLGYVPAQQPVQNTCQSSSVLLANLKKGINQRQYLLPDGHPCSF
jgi:hypothetical protein